VIISIFADTFKNKRVFILAGCLVWWSITTLLTGFVVNFWQMAVLRFGLGIGQAGCNPIATSIIADYFSFELRGTALSIYYWGIYTGYSLSFVIGNAIMEKLVNCIQERFFCRNYLRKNFLFLRAGDGYIKFVVCQAFLLLSSWF